MIELEKFINSRKTPYNQLYHLLNIFKNDPYNIREDSILTSNIFIDLESIFSRLYSSRTVSSGETYLDYIMAIEERDVHTMLASETLNIAGHLRNFFFTRLSMYTNIYFFYTNDINVNLKKKLRDRVNEEVTLDYARINEHLKFTFDLVDSIVKYIPNVHFFRDFNFDKSLIPYHFINPEEYNFIYTNDKIFDQYLSMFPRTHILTHNSNRSQLLSKTTVMNKRFRSSSDKEKGLDFSSKYQVNNLPLLYSISGMGGNYDYLSVTGVGPKTVFKLFDSIDKKYFSNEDIFDYLESKDKLRKYESNVLENKEQILTNLSNISVTSNIYKRDIEVDKLVLKNSMFDLVDGLGLRRVNDTIFGRYPLMMDFLFEGEEYL